MPISSVRAVVAATSLAVAATSLLAVHAGAATRTQTGRSSSTTVDPYAARLAQLPGRMALGVVDRTDIAGAGDWMGASGVPWDYAYHYLTGLGGSANWTVWSSNGRWPIGFAQTVAAEHAIPVFTYFQINHAAGDCGSCTTIGRNLTNLDSTSVMKAWFTDFTTLLKRLSARSDDGVQGYGGTAIVHVEPDLSGYVQQALINPASCPGTCVAGGTGPGDVAAAVASTGLHDLAGFENTFTGFNQAVLALRDKYAPNVLLGYHVSNWAGRWNINSNTSSTINYLSVANSVGTFAAAAGAASTATSRHYDVLFNDVADGDAGAYESQAGNSTQWWDADNAVEPTFNRWERYLGRITSITHLPVFVWQVPIGNQYFLTEDNTYGHTQDNRLQYFMDHPSELRDIGVRGILFGTGPGSTKNWDDQGDGVYNGVATHLCSSRGHSSGPVCWSNVSRSSDDDGGYLAMRAGGYYANGPLPAVTP